MAAAQPRRSSGADRPRGQVECVSLLAVTLMVKSTIGTESGDIHALCKWHGERLADRRQSYLVATISHSSGKIKWSDAGRNVLPDRMIVTIKEFEVMVKCPKCRKQVDGDEIFYDCLYCNRQPHCRDCPNCRGERFFH